MLFLDTNVTIPLILAFIFLASYRVWRDREFEAPDSLSRQEWRQKSLVQLESLSR